MRITETQLYNMINKELHDICCLGIGFLEEQIHICRVESGGSCPGIPDINVCIRGIEFWIECKVVNVEGSRNQLKPMQKSWAKHRSMSGGKSFVLRYNSVHDKFTLLQGEKLITNGDLHSVLIGLLAVVLLIEEVEKE